MAVWCRQSVDGVADDPYAIAPHAPDQSDAALLALKAKGAADKGWAVTWTADVAFSASKVRWGGSDCLREFWAD
ncbi:MAG: hypothetical protein ABIS21_01025 [Acidimicrobiales bacterium]